MARNNNNDFEIPIPLIIVAFIVSWPVGVILAILRAVSSASSQQQRASSANSTRMSASQMRAQFEAERAAEANRQKNAAMQQELNKKRAAEQAASHYAGAGTPESRGVTNPYYREQTAKRAEKQAASSEGHRGLIVGGIISAVMAGFTFLIVAASGASLAPALALLSFPVLFTIGFFVGAKVLKNRTVELDRIRKIIGNKESINLSKLASASGKSLKKIRKQLQRMIDRGEFGDHAYLDLGTNNFMRNPDAQPDDPEGFDYRTVYGDLFTKKDGKDSQEEGGEAPEEDTDEARFAKIIAEIRRLNDEIEDPAVSERIERIEEYTKSIFGYVIDRPDMMPQIRTFMNYYLPTTLKLLESYSRIERVGVAGENMKKSKENIENILDLLVVGFEQQLDQLFRNESIDINADIGVLETMMQKDGLNGKSDFDLSTYVSAPEPKPESKEVTVPKAEKKEEIAEDFTDGFTDEISDEIGGSGAMAAKAPEKD